MHSGEKYGIHGRAGQMFLLLFFHRNMPAFRRVTWTEPSAAAVKAIAMLADPKLNMTFASIMG
jgi:hypothetical protein